MGVIFNINGKIRWRKLGEIELIILQLPEKALVKKRIDMGTRTKKLK